MMTLVAIILIMRMMSIDHCDGYDHCVANVCDSNSDDYIHNDYDNDSDDSDHCDYGNGCCDYGHNAHFD